MSKEEASSSRGYMDEMVIKTHCPVHVCKLKWSIEKVSRLSGKLPSCNIKPDTECEPEFQLVAKFVEKYPGISNINFGLLRVDNGKAKVQVEVVLKLSNSAGIQYCFKEVSISSLGYGSPYHGSPHYFMSELFTALPNKLKFPKSYSSDSAGTLSVLDRKGLIGLYSNGERVYVLPEDVLTLACTARISGCCVKTETIPPAHVQQRFTDDTLQKKLLIDIRTALESGSFSDVKLVMGSEHICVHKFILCCRSPVFRSMFDHETQEKRDGTIVITDFSKVVMDALVWYFYTGVIKKVPFSVMCGLYEAADKYEVLLLHQACSQVLRLHMSNETVCKILSLAHLHGDAQLKKEAIAHVVNNFSKVKATPEWELTICLNAELVFEVLDKAGMIPSPKSSHISVF